jgi:hypothetical protein
VGARFSTPVQTGPGDHPASCKMGTGFFPGVKSGRGVTLPPHPLLVPWSREGRAPLWVVQPVQSLSACTRAHFFFLTLWLFGYLCSFLHPGFNYIAMGLNPLSFPNAEQLDIHSMLTVIGFLGILNFKFTVIL